MPINYNFAIIIMALITFYVRYAFFSHTLPIKINHQVGKLLLFTAPCVLIAMIMPIMFKDFLRQSASLPQVFTSHYFLAGLITFGLSLLIRNSLAVIILGMMAFYMLRFYL